MANAHPPPVPPANRPKHPGAAQNDPKAAKTLDKVTGHGETENLQQGRSGDIHQNTTHQGYQQDR
jgi:hypothetical protein